MKTFRHLFLAAGAALLLLLTGCARNLRTATAADAGSIPLREGAETGFSYDYSVEYIIGGVPAEVRDRIHAAIIRDLLYDDAREGMRVPEACARWAESSQADYLAEIEELAGGAEEEAAWMFNWSRSVSGAFTGADRRRGWQSYRSSSSEYSGGAHGMYGETYHVFDMATGGIVREADFLDMECSGTLSDLLAGKILESLGQEGDAVDALLGNPYPNGNFSVDGQGVTWHFNPYEIAPYAMGILEATLSWDELEPFLK